MINIFGLTLDQQRKADSAAKANGSFWPAIASLTEFFPRNETIKSRTERQVKQITKNTTK